MGQSKSTAQDLTENGVVNSNFVVQQEQEYNVTKDVKIILYLLVAMMAASLGIKLFQIYMKSVRKQIRRNLTASTFSVAPVPAPRIQGLASEKPSVVLSGI